MHGNVLLLLLPPVSLLPVFLLLYLFFSPPGSCLSVQERSACGRVPVKLKLSCKQGGREQQTRSYTLPFPHAAASQLRATALGSVEPALTRSSAVHTLIPNLAPRSRLQQQGLSISSGSGSKTLGSPFEAAQGGNQLQLSGAEELSDRPGSSCNNAGEELQNECHQAARQAIFQAAMSLLKPKLAEPVLVNFMSVAGASTPWLLYVLLHVCCIWSFPVACTVRGLLCIALFHALPLAVHVMQHRPCGATQNRWLWKCKIALCA